MAEMKEKGGRGETGRGPRCEGCGGPLELCRR